MYPTAPPSIAPMNSDGAKMPPEPPLEYELTVAASLSTQKPTINSNGMVPVSASSRVLYGSPAMPFKWNQWSPTTARAPVPSPPNAGWIHLGTAFQLLKSARRFRSPSVKAMETTAARTPSSAYHTRDDAVPSV